jgi:hypothetical protein
MMQNAPLDEHVKKQLGDYEPDVPAHIWENIMARKNKKRPFGLWVNLFKHKPGMLVGLLALVISGAGITWFLNHQNSNNTIADIPTNNQSTTQQPIKGSDINDTKTGNSLPEKNTVTENTIEPSNTDATIKQPLNEKSNTGTTVSDNNPIPVQSANRFESNAGSRKEKVLMNEKVKPVNYNEMGDDHNKNYIASHRNKSTRKTSSLSKISVTTTGSETDVTDESESSEQGFEAAKDRSLNRLILSLNAGYPEKSFLGTIKKPNIPTLSIPCPESERDAAANKRYIEIYGGPDYAIRSFDDTANSAYLQKRKESTRFASAFSAGIRYTRVFNNAMSFRTGVNFSQVNEKFTFVQGNIIQVVYVTDANGDTTGSYATTATRYKTTFNKYRTIDIPLLIGYEMGNGRFHTNLSAGVIINLYSWQKGDVLDTAYKPINISTGGNASPYQFKTNMGVGLMGSASVYYKLNKHLHLLAEPYIRYNMSAANKADITLKQKFTTIGLRLGLRMDF